MKSIHKISILVVIIFLSQSASALTNIDTCGTLNLANEIYNLTANVSNESTCFTISANNITLDGNGFTVNYSQVSTGYAINNSGGYDNITLKNLRIVQGSTSSSAYAIYGSGMANSTITNSTITTLGNSGSGIRLVSSSQNTVLYNNVTTSGIDAHVIFLTGSSNNFITSNNAIVTVGGALGIYFQSGSNSNTLSDNIVLTSSGAAIFAYSSSNKISGGSISSNTGSSYYIWSSTDNFTNTNFTASRKIQFGDATSWFNYNNETTGNIWLKTSVSAAGTITRTLVKWSQQEMRWNDSATLTANYNLTGLFANTQFNIYNTTAGTTTNLYTLTTDSNGALNFSIALNGNTEILVNASPPYGLASCQDLTIAGGSYVLVANVSSASTCFNIKANNITLDGNGFTVNYSQVSTGYGVNSSYNYTTVKNCNIIQGNSSVANHLIYFNNNYNGAIFNNTIASRALYKYGIALSNSDNNTVYGNGITTSVANTYSLNFPRF